MSGPALTRRETIVGGAALLAAVIGVPVAVIEASRTSDAPTDRQRAVLRSAADMVIPRTDTPGAVDVGADDFVVLALAHGLDGTREPAGSNAINGATARYRREDGTLDHLAWLERELDSGAHGDFLRAGAAPLRALTALDAAVFADRESDSPWKKIKDLILTAYYTSEAGGSKELRYELVPGRFDPDLPQTAATRAFSSDWTAVEFG